MFMLSLLKTKLICNLFHKITADYFCQNIIPIFEDLTFPNGRINESKKILSIINNWKLI